MLKSDSYGFRPIGYHSALITKFRLPVGSTGKFEGDIKVCLDSIPHDKLIQLLEKRNDDHRLLQLIRN
jgi:retron-type reverse transcriptase